MAYCASCGAQMDGQFCPKCGAQKGVAPVVPIARPATAGRAEMGMGVNVASALCYVLGFVTGIVFLALAPYNRNKEVRFHAFQSIILSVAVVLVHAAVTVVALMLQVVSFSLGLLVSSLHLVVSVGFFVVWLYMMWNCYRGERVVLPVIGELAERQAGGNGPDSPSGTIGRAA